MASTTTAVNPSTPNQYEAPPSPSTPTSAVAEDAPWPHPYYLSEGLRRVAPYHFTYNTFCKERWRGREILDIFASEFRDRSREYYKTAIETGQIAINEKPCQDVHQVVKNGDVVSHTLHRHEPPVTARPIRVITETDDLIIIDKPPGVPVHPAGRYMHNSVVEIMRAERKSAFNPLPCNRLDRLTSGVMFIGKEKKEAERISEKLRSRTMRKEYVARVKGRFPAGVGQVNGNLGGVVTCDENILQISPILGLNRARASGKTAKTLFRRIAYYPPKESTRNNNSEESCAPAPPAAPFPATESSDGYSVVHCLPLTGRTHQIRVHLQFLGHPIINDPIYANRRVFGSKLAIHDSSPAQDEEIIRQLAKMGKTEVADAIDYDNNNNKNNINTRKSRDREEPVEQTMQTCLATQNEVEQNAQDQQGQRQEQVKTSDKSLPFSSPSEYASFVSQHDAMVSDYNKRRGERRTGEKCPICATDLYSDPGPHELGIYLHALAYSDADGSWQVRSGVPEWAVPDRSRRSGGYEGAGETSEDLERETEIKAALTKGWVYDGSEVAPEETDRVGLNRRGLQRNKGELVQ